MVSITEGLIGVDMSTGSVFRVIIQKTNQVNKAWNIGMGRGGVMRDEIVLPSWSSCLIPRIGVLTSRIRP